MLTAIPPIEPPEADRLNQFVRLMEVAGILYRANPANKPKRVDISRDDAKDLFQNLNHNQGHYLLVCGMASAAHGHLRATQDFDLWIQIGDENKTRLIAALSASNVAGAEYLKDTPLLFDRTRPGWTSVVTGNNRLTLDMGHSLKAFSEIDFDACYARSLEASFDGVPFRVIQMNDLIHEKRATGRLKDLADVEELLKI